MINFNIKALGKSAWQIAGLALLVVGLVASLFLVQKAQEYRSRASQEVMNAFEVTDAEGEKLEVEGDAYKTQSLNVKIKVKDLEALSE